MFYQTIAWYNLQPYINSYKIMYTYITRRSTANQLFPWTPASRESRWHWHIWIVWKDIHEDCKSFRLCEKRGSSWSLSKLLCWHSQESDLLYSTAQGWLVFRDWKTHIVFFKQFLSFFLISCQLTLDNYKTVVFQRLNEFKLMLNTKTGRLPVGVQLL